MRRRRNNEEPVHQERWLVSYADFMTLLFALFVVLFASSYHDKMAIQRVSSAVKTGFQEMRAFPYRQSTLDKSQSSSAKSEEPRSPDAGIDVAELLLPGAADKIKRISGVLMQYGLDMRVEGHSDDVPIHNATFSSNWDLSTARASAVAMMLLNESGFDPKRISIAGYAQYHPNASNDTPEGRRANRRVDIVILSPTGSPVAKAM